MEKLFCCLLVLCVVITLTESREPLAFYLAKLNMRDWPRYYVTYKNVTIELRNKGSTSEAIDKDDPENCLWGETKIPVGSSVRPTGECKTVTCTEPGKVFITRCGMIAFDEKVCKSLGEDMSKVYPYCCHRLSCNDVDGNKFAFNPLAAGQGDLVEEDAKFFSYPTDENT